MTALGDVMAVIVHHRQLPVVLETVRAVIRAGVSPDRVIVIDNSEDEDVATALREAAHGWMVRVVPNRGYGAAVNVGVTEGRGVAPYTLVMTHEARCNSADLELMVNALREHPDVAVAGPDFLRQGDAIWSRGGSLSRHLRLPRHRLDVDPSTSVLADVDWVDGAIAVYRTDTLREEPFREDFFLYFEETELHTRFRELGWRVVTASGSVAQQSSEGMPAFWAVRNTLLFQALHGTRISRALAPWYVLARTCGVAIAGGHWAETSQAIRGIAAGHAAVRAAAHTNGSQ